MFPFSASWPQAITRALLQTETEELSELTDLSPVVVLEAERREWAFLKNERHYGLVNNQPAVAAELSAVGLIMPETTDGIAVVYFCRNAGATIADIIVGTITPGAASVPGGNTPLPVFGLLDAEEVSRPPGGAIGGSSFTKQFAAHSVGGIGQSGPFNPSEALPTAQKISIASDNWAVVLRPGGFMGLQADAVP